MVEYQWAVQTQDLLMTTTEELEQNYEAAAALWKKYEGRLDDFRNKVKQDVASLEASARKTTEASQRINKAYSDVVVQLNSQEMLTAIDNAERLARALNAIANMQSHKLTFAVIDAAKPQS